MKRLLVGLVAAMLVVAVVPGSALATHSNGKGPGNDLLTGTSKGPVATPFGTFPGQTHINAISDATGADSRGQFYTRIFSGAFAGDVEFSGDIVCLNVIDGDTAIIRAVITESNSGFVPVGFGILGINIDNGEGANDPPDEAGGFLTGPPPPTCPAFPFGSLPIDQGNWVVHNAL